MQQSMNLSMKPYTQAGAFVCSQYDVGRECQIKLVDDNGDYVIPTGATVTVMATKPSGLGFAVACTWSGSTVTLATTETMTNEFGRFPAEIRVTSGDTVLGTTNFFFKVERSPHPEGTVDGDAETIINQITLLVNRAEAAADEAVEQAQATIDEILDTIPQDIAALKSDLLTLEQEGYPMASIQEAVDAWADEHEAEIVNAYVTPEMFGAKGDGVTDDTTAIQAAFNSAMPVYFSKKTYCISSALTYRGHKLFGFGTIKTTTAVSYPIQCIAKNISINGLIIDCNGVSNTGIYCYGDSTGFAEIKGCEVFNTDNNVHETSCSGIYVTNFGKNLIEGCYIHDINRTKTNPGNMSSSGIIVATDGQAVICNNRIVGVSCSNETTDCDGIYVAYRTGPQNATNIAVIFGNVIIDATGRFVKTQCNYASIRDNRCILSNSASGLYIKAFDFQTGGGECANNYVDFGSKAANSAIFCHADYNVNVKRDITILGNQFIAETEINCIFYANGVGIGGLLTIENNIFEVSPVSDYFVKISASSENAIIRVVGNKANIYRVFDALSSTDFSALTIYFEENTSDYVNNGMFSKAVTINNLVIRGNIGIVEQVANITMDYSEMKTFDVFYRGATPIANLPSSITDGNSVYLRKCSTGLVQYYETAHGRSGIIQA